MDRQEEIRSKGFRMDQAQFNRMRINRRTIDNVLMQLGALENTKNYRKGKNEILRALGDGDINSLRSVSQYFFRTNGIYTRACNYLAQMYRYDWYIVPEIYDKKTKEDKIMSEFQKILSYLDNSYIKILSEQIAERVIVDGAYYVCVIPSNEQILLQELPVDYCRSRYKVGNLPAVELNMGYFDIKFPDPVYRQRVLQMFPIDIQKGYMLFKQGKLPADCAGEKAGWYLLEPGMAFKFSMSHNGQDIPLFANAIPSIIDLDEAQDLDRRKQMQKLLKIIVQRLPIDKNGDLIFDIEEGKDLHANAVEMLANAIGVDVLTTFAEIDSIDLSDTTSTTATDDLERVERTVYNNLGVSQNIFNTEGNLALEKSVLADEGAIRPLLLQIATLFDYLTQKKISNKKYKFRLYMLETTQYNYKELSKMYKEQVQIGYSKMLPQIALGHSQSFIVNSCYFENKILKLHEIMIPPLMSSTMSSETVLGKTGNSTSSNSQNSTDGGRPEKPDDQKSEKTIANKESQG